MTEIEEEMQYRKWKRTRNAIMEIFGALVCSEVENEEEIDGKYYINRSDFDMDFVFGKFFEIALRYGVDIGGELTDKDYSGWLAYEKNREKDYEPFFKEGDLHKKIIATEDRLDKNKPLSTALREYFEKAHSLYFVNEAWGTRLDGEKAKDGEE